MRLQSTVLFLLVGLLHVPGYGGTNSSGGGSRLESAWRLRASALIQKVAQIQEANGLCTAAQMRVGLDGLHIKTVKSLVDTRTGRRIRDVSLDAWTTPGSMQLLEDKWSAYLFDAERPEKAVDALILHEVYRATGVCDDSNGQISTRVVELISQSTRNSTAQSSYSVGAIETIPGLSGEITLITPYIQTNDGRRYAFETEGYTAFRRDRRGEITTYEEAQEKNRQQALGVCRIFGYATTLSSLLPVDPNQDATRAQYVGLLNVNENGEIISVVNSENNSRIGSITCK